MALADKGCPICFRKYTNQEDLLGEKNKLTFEMVEVI